MSSALVAKLASLVGRDRVSTRKDDLLGHAVDAYGRGRVAQAAKPLAVVFARTAEDVQQVVAFAAETETPVVPYGGGTGVTGGAMSVRPGIVLDLRGLDQVHALDVESQTAEVGAGMLLEDLYRHAESHGLLFAHDPWSLPIATVGGSIAINGVGYLAGKYGSMGQQVLGLEVVLPTGRVVRTRAVSKASGPGLTPLFIGAEGTLGVITRSTVRLFPWPERRALLAFGFKSFEHGFHAAMEMYRIGLTPSLLDFSEEPLATRNGDSGATLYLGFEGPGKEVAAQESIGRRICQTQGGQLLPTRQVKKFWATRHQSGERYKQEVLARPPTQRAYRPWRMDYLHVTVPASRVLEYHRCCRGLAQRYEAPVHEWSLWGRPEYFSLLVADPSPGNGNGSEVLRALAVEMLMLAHAMGGSMEYCHGVGLKLGAMMGQELGPAMGLLRSIKGALDPGGIMNPGKMGL